MNDDLFGWGVVGLGRHFDRYFGTAIDNSANGRLAAVCSRDEEKGRAKTASFKGVNVHTSLADLLNDDSVEGVVLLTPNNLHRDEVLQIAAAGRHVLCEKPLANTAQECLDMITACADNNVRLGVGFHLRHNVVHQKARDYVASGQLGTLELVECRYFHIEGVPSAPSAALGFQTPADSWRNDPTSMGGGRFTSTGGHAIDLVRFVTGLDVATVQGAKDPSPGLQDERLIQSLLVLDGGVIGSIVAGWQTFPFNELMICGSEGSLRCTDTIGNVGGGRLELLSTTKSEDVVFAAHDVYLAEAEAFVASVRSGSDPDAAGIDGLRALEIYEAVYEAVEKGTRVDVPRSAAIMVGGN